MENYKVVFLGLTGNGKTCLIRNICDEPFDNLIRSTAGAGYYSKIITNSLGKINLDIWDTGGRETNNWGNRHFYKNAHCVILCFEFTGKESFKMIKDYYYPTIEYELGDYPLIYLVGNKIDLYESSDVSIEEAESYAKEVNIKYFGVSAKTGEGVKELLDDISYSLMFRFSKNPIVKRVK